MEEALVFAPAAISTFYAPKDCEGDGSLTLAGAWGGGFKLDKGVLTHVTLGKGEDEVEIGGGWNPGTSLTAVNVARRKLKFHGALKVRHRVEVPVGAGFGSSAAGAVGVGVGSALLAGASYDIGIEIAHEADIIARTGLQTAAATSCIDGPAGVIVDPGYPGSCKKVDVPSCDLAVVTITLGIIDKREILVDRNRNEELRSLGLEVLDKVSSEGTIESLMMWSYEFAQRAGFLDPVLKRMLAEISAHEHVIGASQNMIGRALHALVKGTGHAILLAEGISSAYPDARIDLYGLYWSKPKGLIRT